MNSPMSYHSNVLRNIKPGIFLVGLILLGGTWIMLWWVESLFTESHLVSYTCCLAEQDLPSPGSMEKVVNDFFAHSPGRYLPSLIFILLNISFFVATLRFASEKQWLPFMFIGFNLIYIAFSLWLVTFSWLISDLLVGPQTTPYKGYHRTWYGIVFHFTLWAVFFATIWRVKKSLALRTPRRRMMKILVTMLSISLITFSLLVLLRPEGYFYLYPSIDTRYAPEYDEEAFQTIQMGMSKKEVLERLGPPLNAIEDQGWVYSEDNAFPYWDFAWLVRAVNFDSDGRVIVVSVGVNYD